MYKNRKFNLFVIITLFVLSLPISASAATAPAGEPMSFNIDVCDEIRVPYSSEKHQGCVEASGTVTLNDLNAELDIFADVYVIEAPRGPDSPTTPPRINESIRAEWLLFTEDGQEKSLILGGDNISRVSEIVEQDGSFTDGILTIYATLKVNGGSVDIRESFSFNLQKDILLDKSGILDREDDRVDYQIVPVGDSITVDLQVIEGNAPINWILFDQEDNMVAWLDSQNNSQQIAELIFGEQYRLSIYTWETDEESVRYEVTVTGY
ncbi:hypothetical protein [Chengkuizengella sediminis]|uniref:hypothetical protein n=1 Tax=Chengkuizengella sediminis TaxID=1885917 RepID=UPI00138A0D21|nr:hypothetical protein [Chengkuizengella sediminis]NDI35497.1 hypothetical protein [Chengkuizengella sediminis]